MSKKAITSDQPQARRILDQTPAVAAGLAVQRTSQTFWKWFNDHNVDSLALIIITLSLTIRVVEWAMDFASLSNVDGTQRAAVIAAVLGPWGLMQAAMFKFYVELKAKTNPTTTNGA